MFAFAEITHHSLETGCSNQILFVKVVELTHEKRLNKRAIIEYTFKGENLRHFIPRDRLIAPNIVHSEILFYHYASGFEYCVEARADFFKHPDELFVNMTTKLLITELKVNGHKMKNSLAAAVYMNADRDELERKILEKLIEYIDELPF